MLYLAFPRQKSFSCWADRTWAVAVYILVWLAESLPPVWRFMLRGKQSMPLLDITLLRALSQSHMPTLFAKGCRTTIVTLLSSTMPWQGCLSSSSAWLYVSDGAHELFCLLTWENRFAWKLRNLFVYKNGISWKDSVPCSTKHKLSGMKIAQQELWHANPCLQSSNFVAPC